MVRFTKWLASLSDGSTAIERAGRFTERKGELSAWLKLRAFRKKHGVDIRGMQIQVKVEGEAVRTYVGPSHSTTPEGNHERFASLWPIKPSGYNYRRWLTGSLTSEDSQRHELEICTEFELTEPGIFYVSLIVDEDEGTTCWVVVHQ